MDKKSYMELCGRLISAYVECAEIQQYEKELREQVLEHSDGCDVPMGKYTITFECEKNCRKFDMGKLRNELRERFDLKEDEIDEFIESSTGRNPRKKRIAIKQTAKMKPKTHTARKAA